MQRTVITNYDSNNIKAIDKFINEQNNQFGQTINRKLNLDYDITIPKVTISKESRKKCVESLIR